MQEKPKLSILFSVKDKEKPYKIPEYATQGSSGMDLYSSNTEDVIILPGDVRLVDTNICIEMPEGVEAQIRSRSGLALKNQIFVLNSPGTIDSSYRGTIGVILANYGNQPFIIKPLTRIAQMVFANVITVALWKVDELGDTARGEGGFGSTGLK